MGARRPTLSVPPNCIGYKLWFMNLLSLALPFVLPFVATLIGTGALLPFLVRRAILDHPNQRSSHTTPTPKGGGIVMMPVIGLCWVGFGLYFGTDPVVVTGLAGLAFALAAISWVDDLRGLSPLVRLLVQIVAVSLALTALPDPGPYFQGLLPPPADTVVAGLLWVWFINLFNFMDGIDGIAGVESLTIGLGVSLIVGGPPGLLGLIIVGAALGFLKWNWHPAKIFLGDVGSVPLGFLLGWLLLQTAADGNFAAALILPGYYLADSGITLLRRMLKGEKVWQAHRQHFYQQAVQRGLSHAIISTSVFFVGLPLIGLAWLSAQGWPLSSLGTAVLLSLGFLLFLRGRPEA